MQKHEFLGLNLLMLLQGFQELSEVEVGKVQYLMLRCHHILMLPLPRCLCIRNTCRYVCMYTFGIWVHPIYQGFIQDVDMAIMERYC